MASRYRHDAKEHVLLIWVGKGVRKGVGVFCRGVHFFEFDFQARMVALALRRQGITAYSRKFNRGTYDEWLLLVEDGLDAEKQKIIKSAVANQLRGE